MTRRDDLELVKLCTVENPVEAQVLEGLLADAGIPSQLITWHSTPYDGIFESQRGHAEMRVRAVDLDAAQEVLEDFRASAEAEPPADQD
ncbi:MAG: DUF2007 domain-containing protein [Candidatus Krumholzibacteriia bacterium]|nr:DUF2007 domain-containing protein [bacterium]MCB9513312.1 DUF2007 domain-containing protein [Candidatus Latescibacterota bacterium]MCB9514772.1 DUF2007 domain-containing protein [Candidatus Latescibacterota bacterium]